MENTKKINVYLDIEFLKCLFKEQKNAFGEKNKTINNFIDFLQKKHVDLFFADNGLKIDKHDLFRVFLASDFEENTKNLRSKNDYLYANTKKLSSINNNYLFFFGEKYKDYGNLRKESGFLFFNYNVFVKEWKFLSENRTIHIQQQTEGEKKVGSFWENIFTNLLKVQNYIMIVDPYLNSWKKELIINNLNSIQELKSNIKNINLYVLAEKKNKNIELLSQNLVNIEYSIFLFNRDNHSLRDKIKNYLHDRYIYTNYYQICSAHSWDYVHTKNNKKIIPKNTQITISSIINEDTFNFMISKFKNYKELIDASKKAKNVITERKSANFKNIVFKNIN